jgi:Ca2+-binding EF-hand superfamily protein
MGKNRPITSVEVKEIIHDYDLNQDGEIDVDELKMLVLKVIRKKGTF